MNGRISGFSPSALADNLGHSVQVNEDTYTKRVATKTKLDLLLNSQKQPLTLAWAVLVTKTLLMTHTSRMAREAVIDFLAAIYHEDAEAIADMLR